jgi:DMSO/TMAO reductase YedYZ molybdopterin-dependent catalytic subunit
LQTERTGIGIEELDLAARNHAMPQEALRYDVTPAGLHYVLVHYDIPDVDPAAFRLTVDGHVERTLELTLDDIRARPAVTAQVTMECAGNGRALLEPRAISQPWLRGAVGNATWTGTPLAPLLEEAGVRDAVDVAFTGLDHGLEGGVEQDYERGLPLPEAMRPDLLLAYEMNGQPLLPQHGFPLRLLVPGWYGMTSVKWLTRIRVLDAPYTGYQNVTGYRYRRSEDDESGTPVERIRVRSLMVPPGFPSFQPRTRHLSAGPTRLTGRAWSGTAPIGKVELSTDGGATWADADLGPEPQAHAWRSWSFDWEATLGQHVLCCRATDADGQVQPDEPEWNVGGYANNAVERIEVDVRASSST